MLFKMPGQRVWHKRESLDVLIKRMIDELLQVQPHVIVNAFTVIFSSFIAWSESSGL